MSKLRLQELTSGEAGQLAEDGGVVIVPTGALEQHGPHLPLQTDYSLAHEIGVRAAAVALNAHGVQTVVTPPLWAGFSPHHMRYPGTISLTATTWMAVLSDVCGSLWEHGFRRILVLNGHGGNVNLMAAAAQTLRFERQVRVAVASYWSFALEDLAAWRQSEPGGINHACEMETSLMLSAFPDLCNPERAHNSERPIESSYFSPDLLIGAAVTTPWDFAELSEDGTIGAPEAASRERGDALMDLIVDRVADFLLEMNGWDWSNPQAIAKGPQG